MQTFCLIITHINFPQVKDSQLNRKLSDRNLEEDIISLSGELDYDELLGCNLEDLQKNHPPTQQYSIMNEVMDGPPTNHNKYQPYQLYTNTNIYITFPDVPPQIIHHNHHYNITTT